MSDNKINEYLNQPQILTIDRTEGEELNGFLVGTSENLAVVNVVSDEIWLNGYAIINLSDIFAVEAETLEESFGYRAIDAMGETPTPITPALNIESWATALATVPATTVISLACEEDTPDEMYVGVVQSVTDTTVTIKEIDLEGQWADPVDIALDDITRVDIEGRYEQIFTALAAKL